MLEQLKALLGEPDAVFKGSGTFWWANVPLAKKNEALSHGPKVSATPTYVNRPDATQVWSICYDPTE